MTLAYVVLAVLALLLSWVAVSYIALARARRQVGEAWNRLDLELGRRHEVVPALVAAARSHLGGERETLQLVTAARAAAVLAREPAVVKQTEARLTGALTRLDALADAHPQLRAADSFRMAQSQLTGIESDIEAARESYNATVQHYNGRARRFPMRLSGTHAPEFVEVERPARRSVPKVAF
jgi:LemA protein